MRTMKRNLLSLLLVCLSFYAYNQNTSIHLSNGKYFKFNKGAEEWSEPLTVDLSPYKAEGSIPLSIRIKYKKRMLLACHYYVEITNLSDSKSVKLVYSNGYTDASGKTILHKVKLKSKGVYEGKIMYAKLGDKPKSAEDCLDCSWQLDFSNVKIK